MESIVVTRKIPGINQAIAKLPSAWQVWVNPSEHGLSRTELQAKAKSATGIVVVGDKIDAELMETMPKLRVLSNYGVGIDNIDLVAARKNNITVTNLPDEVTYSTAELTIALMLACARRLPAADRLVREHNPFPWTPSINIGSNLKGKVLGIVGFGRIGQQVAKMAKAFEIRVIYTNRSKKEQEAQVLEAEYRSLSSLLQECDILSLHVPGGEVTRHLIGPRELAQLKSSAILINVARGTVLDERALVKALQEKKLAAAGLDVYEFEPAVTPELIKLDNVVLTPHIGVSTWETRIAMTKSAVDKLRQVLAK